MTDITNPESAAATHPAVFHPYKVACVERIGTPDGGEGHDWHRYVLERGRSTITGQRRGSRKDVLAYATLCAEQLNARGLNSKSIWSPRGRKPATT